MASGFGSHDAGFAGHDPGRHRVLVDPGHRTSLPPSSPARFNIAKEQADRGARVQASGLQDGCCLSLGLDAGTNINGQHGETRSVGSAAPRCSYIVSLPNTQELVADPDRYETQCQENPSTVPLAL